MSEAVFQSRESKNASRLIKAMEQWTTPYDISPTGVFGSVATFKCGQVTISSDTLDLEFVVPFDDDMEANEAEIIVYNLTDNTIKQLKKGSLVTLEAGYKGDTGLVFSGYITKVKTVYEDADKVTTIFAADDVKDHSIQSVSFAAGTKASYILKDLLGRTGTPIAVFKVRRDHTYKDSQTVDGDLMENIKKYAQVCGISVYVSKGKIYARYIKEGDNLDFLLSPDTGLIGSPMPFTEEITAEDYTDIVDGYEAETLFQHRLTTGGIVTLKTKSANGTYRVCSGEHRFSPDEAVTKVKMY